MHPNSEEGGDDRSAFASLDSVPPSPAPSRHPPQPTKAPRPTALEKLDALPIAGALKARFAPPEIKGMPGHQCPLLRNPAWFRVHYCGHEPGIPGTQETGKRACLRA